MTTLKQKISSGVFTSMYALCTAGLFSTGYAIAVEDETNFSDAIQYQPSVAAADETSDGDVAPDGGVTGKPARLEVGMSLEDALKLLGKAPDSEEEVGGACGMLDILNWDVEGIKIISVDGTVTSIMERKKK